MIYFDNSATTRPCKSCVDVMLNVMQDRFANASSLHLAGVESHREIEKVKNALASSLGCTPNEILIGPGGTYCNNLAMHSAVSALKRRGNKIVLSSIEHPSVSEYAAILEKDGFKVVYCNPLTDDFEKEIDKSTILVSCMLVNNETGLILDVDKLRGMIDRAGSVALLHVDAVQAFGKIPVNVKRLGCDFLTVSGHKINGPKGIGALYVKRGVRVSPIVHGGEQENGVIPGTYNTPAAAGFAAAIEEMKTKPTDYLNDLNQYFRKRVSEFDFIKINSYGNHAPHVINITFDGYLGENILHFFEGHDIFVSQGSACSSHSRQKGKTLTALGESKRISDGSIRVSFDYNNTVNEIDEFFEVCSLIPEKLIKFYK